MKKNIYSADVNNQTLYVKSYRKLNAFKFFKKMDDSIQKKDVIKTNKLDPSIKVIEELYPEYVDNKKESIDKGKYYNMFK